jgi:hypothetical protein
MPHKNSPISIVSRALGGKTFDSKKSVLGGQDWLRQLTFDVKNVSNKNVIYFNIDLVVPKHGKMPGLVAFSIFFGNRMGPALLVPGDSDENDKLVRPGDVVKVKLSDEEISRWETELKSYEVEDVTFVTVDIRTVHFDDGTCWQLGNDLRQDPDNPRRWMPPDQFKPTTSLLLSLRKGA